MKSKLEIILTWANLQNISKPLSSIKLKSISAVLTRNGVGIDICPKCSELNLVRDGLFRCNCGFKANIIDCICGMCEKQLLDRDRWGNPPQYIFGHLFGNKHWNWKGGKIINGDGYVQIYKSSQG